MRLLISISSCSFCFQSWSDIDHIWSHLGILSVTSKRAGIAYVWRRLEPSAIFPGTYDCIHFKFLMKFPFDFVAQQFVFVPIVYSIANKMSAFNIISFPFLFLLLSSVPALHVASLLCLCAWLVVLLAVCAHGSWFCVLCLCMARAVPRFMVHRLRAALLCLGGLRAALLCLGACHGSACCASVHGSACLCFGSWFTDCVQL